MWFKRTVAAWVCLVRGGLWHPPRRAVVRIQGGRSCDWQGAVRVPRGCAGGRDKWPGKWEVLLPNMQGVLWDRVPRSCDSLRLDSNFCRHFRTGGWGPLWAVPRTPLGYAFRLILCKRMSPKKKKCEPTVSCPPLCLAFGQHLRPQSPPPKILSTSRQRPCMPPAQCPSPKWQHLGSDARSPGA